eukprot:GFUD01042617.1.p1 GENE.GFUD01042617.1~~GFUD01042617.1.p1  ORF type:complete len:260 (-),score=65.84 GFUD01042617.1:49-828(-)
MYHGEVNVAQEELNSFLAVAEDLKVKGLTQNSSESKSLPRSTDLSKPRPRDPPDRIIEATPPPKRPRPPPPMPRSAPPPPSSIYHPEEDDIQEVVPVKSEPISHHPDPPNHTHTPAPMAQIEQPYIAPAPQVPQMQHEGVVADPNMEYGEEYGEYEGYEVGMDGSYEGSMLDNSGMGGNDGNKELDMLISGALAKDPVTGEWKCTYCNKTNKNKARITRHVEVHFPGFTQQCPYCEKQLVSRNALRNHVSDVHTKGQRM